MKLYVLLLGNTQEPKLSKDAAIVQALTERLAWTGFTGEVFSVLSRQCPEWTRERWERASQELEQLSLEQEPQAVRCRAGEVVVSLLAASKRICGP